MNAELSKGWAMKPVKAVAKVISGATPSRDEPLFWEGSIPWITPKELSRLDDPVIKDTEERITELGYQRTSCEILPAGSILLSSRAPIGHIAIAGVSMCTNQGFKSLVPKPGVVSKYLYWAMQSRKDGLIALGRGATFKEVSKPIVEDFELPFPDSEKEQNRIASILDKADAIRRKRQQALRLTDDFLRSVFLDMFGDPVSNSKRFSRGTIRDLVESANYGTSEKAHPTDGEYPVLRMNNITYAGGWDFSSLKYIDLESSSAHKYLVSKGQMLFNRTNSKELVGKTAVYRLEQPMAYAGYLVRVTAKPDADSEYISAHLNSNHGKAILLGMCKSIVGMANINAQEMLSIPILLPPEQLQKRFGDVVRLVETRRKSQRKAIEVSDTLFASLQQRAFSGQL